VSRFLNLPANTAPKPKPGRSVYEDRAPIATEVWVQLADIDPFTGKLVWEHDWVQRATGWRPLDEFVRCR
jgi:hypothetical protein